MGTISDVTHVRVVLIFLPGIEKHFICNTLCSSYNFVMWFIEFFTSLMINSVFYKPPEKKSRVKFGEWRG